MAAKGWGVTPRTSAAFHSWVALFAHVTVINRSNHTFPAPLPSVGLWKVKYFIWQYTVNIWIIWIYDGIYDCCFFRRMIKCLLSTGWVAKWILETKHFAWMNNPSYMGKKSIFFQLLYKKNKQTKEKKRKRKKGRPLTTSSFVFTSVITFIYCRKPSEVCLKKLWKKVKIKEIKSYCHRSLFMF